MRKNAASKKGLEGRISGILKPGESVTIIGASGQKKTITASGADNKPMASTRSAVNDIAGITDELVTGKHSVHRVRIGRDKVKVSGMTKEGGEPGSVTLSTTEYLRHCGKEVTLGLRNGSFFTDGNGAIMLAKHIK